MIISESNNGYSVKSWWFPLFIGGILYLSPRGLGEMFYDLVVVGSIFFTKDGLSMSFIALGSYQGQGDFRVSFCSSFPRVVLIVGLVCVPVSGLGCFELVIWEYLESEC